MASTLVSPLFSFFGLAAAAAAGVNTHPDCASFATVAGSSIGDVILINSTAVPANSLNISGEANTAPFCRLFAQVPYPTNNSVLFEIWMPDPEAYNGRFLALGNGGMAGTIDEASMLQNLNYGFACAGGNGGHLASDNNGGGGQPGVYLPYLHDQNQVLAWIHNSVAFFTPPAKETVKMYYGTAAKRSYYKGCSTGGAQGFALAQFHPDLFDGIVAGSPGNWYSHLALSFLWNDLKTLGDSYLPQSALNLITEAVLAKCDALDGVEDGVLENPLECSFDIDTLSCPLETSNSSTCLSPHQLAAVKSIYDGPRDSRSNASLYAGFSFGSETEWQLQEGLLADAFSIPILQNLVFDNLEYNASSFNWGSDVSTVDQRAGVLIDEISPDLSAFKASGGKMIVTQGWSDPLNAATWPINHLEQIEARFGTDVDNWFELFMVPGGGHCGSASNYPQVPAQWHSLEKLVEWVEKGERPQEMLATDPADGSNRTRKLCPWPRTAKYVGGSTDVWTSYICA